MRNTELYLNEGFVRKLSVSSEELIENIRLTQRVL